MAPEQLRGDVPISNLVDVYGAGVVLWEALTGMRLFFGQEGALIYQILSGERASPRAYLPTIPEAYAEIALKALAIQPHDRFRSAEEMANALEAAGPVASQREVGAWLRTAAAARLEARAQKVREIEAATSSVRAIALNPKDGTTALKATVAEVRATPSAQESGSLPVVVTARPSARALQVAGALAILVASLIVVGFALAPRTPEGRGGSVAAVSVAPSAPASTEPVKPPKQKPKIPVPAGPKPSGSVLFEMD
jgi:eukaryotic-like serine/threonine-protein kinase